MQQEILFIVILHCFRCFSFSTVIVIGLHNSCFFLLHILCLYNEVQLHESSDICVGFKQRQRNRSNVSAIANFLPI